MLRSSRQTALAALTLLTAGCGSSADAPSLSKEPATRPAAKAAGPMKVAPVDGRVGDATAATSSGGIQRLKVRRRATDPNLVREGVGAGAACADVDLMPAGDNLPAVAASTLCLVNGRRADAGLPPLTHNPKLDESSLAHSLDMVARSYFAHQGLDGRTVTDRIRAIGYLIESAQWTVGENLAWGTGTLATPEAIVQAWMDSQGHRENILRSSFREAGIGIALGNPQTTDGEGATYTMNFGSVTPDPVASGVTAGTRAPQTSAAERRAIARRLKSCRARARKARPSIVRKARMKRCARVARRASRR